LETGTLKTCPTRFERIGCQCRIGTNSCQNQRVPEPDVRSRGIDTTFSYGSQYHFCSLSAARVFFSKPRPSDAKPAAPTCGCGRRFEMNVQLTRVKNSLDSPPQHVGGIGVRNHSRFPESEFCPGGGY
jgi:hypothetical protein